MKTNRKHYLCALGLLIAVVFTLQSSAAPPLPGAIFTTTSDGTVVNGNTKYASKCDVYLDGGPGPNAPPGAAGLPAGDYYYQVTDPSGKKLLSTDAVENRRFTVSADGVIIASESGFYGPPHPTGIDFDQMALGAITIQLANEDCPVDFLDTPNNGGVYKAWITPVGDGDVSGGGFVGDPTEVDNPCGNGCFHGFIPARSKTDNFKVGDKTPTFCLEVYKYMLVSNKLIRRSYWEITVSDSLGVANMYYTDEFGFVEICGLVAGTYTVSEDLEYGGATFVPVATEVNGTSVTPTSTVEIMWTRGKPDPQVVSFTNEVCKTCK